MESPGLIEFSAEQEVEDLKDQLVAAQRTTALYKRQVNEVRADNHNLRTLLRQVNEVGAMPHNPPNWTIEPPAGKHRGKVVLFISDTHFDEVVRPQEIMGLNAYNREIAEQRIERTFKRAVRLARDFIGAQYAYDGVVVLFGGDMIGSTPIHEELGTTSVAPPADTVNYFTDPLLAGLELLHQEFGNVWVTGVPGNHDRTGRKVPSKLRAIDSWTWTLYANLERHFRTNDMVNFGLTQGAEVTVPIYDTNFVLHHGNDFRGGSGISGFLTPLALGDQRKRRRNMNAARMTGNRDLEFDYEILGHFHQRLILPGIIVGSSLKGYDEFARSMNFDYAEPSQELLIVTPEKGITFEAPVFVADPVEEGWA